MELDLFMTQIEGPGIEGRNAAVAHILAEAFGPEYAVTHNAHGAPVLTPAHPMTISISHNARHAVVAVHRRGLLVGVDIETLRDALLRVRHKFLTGHELDFIQTPEQHLFAWTAKEAVFKAMQHGIDSLAEIALSDDFYLATATNKATGQTLQFDIDYLQLSDDEMVATAVPHQ